MAEETEADRIAEAKAMYANGAADAHAPTLEQLNEEAANQEAPVAEADTAAPAAPEAPPEPPPDLHDQLIEQYKVKAAEPPAPAAPEPPKETTLGDKFKKFMSADTGGDHEGVAVESAATAAPEKLKLIETPPNLQSTGEKVALTDAEATKRAEFNKLNPAKQRAADARLAAAGAPPRAVMLSRGGMMPSSDTVQITQGPEVSDAQRLLHDIEYNSTRSAGDTTTAELNRDTQLASLEGQHSQANAKFAGAEQQIQQKQSDALGAVSDRMAAALKAANTPVVSPAQDLNNMGMGQKLAFILAAAGGGAAGRETGANPFLRGYDQMVQARIDTQKREAEQGSMLAKGQENLYGVMKSGFQSDDAARAGMRLMYLQALDTKMKESALHYNIDTANPRYQALQSQISTEILNQQKDLAKISGQHISEEKTSRYAPPQVAVVGGAPKGEADTRKAFDKYWTEHKLYDKEADLNTLNNIVRNADKGGAVMKYIAAHPGMSYANAFFAARNDPQQKQLMVDIEREVKDSISGSGMRSELGRQLGQTLANAENAQQAYNRLNQEFAGEASSGIAAYGGIDAYKRWRQEAEDIQNSTNSPVQSQGNVPLPKALPEIDETVAPATAETARVATPPSHHKKKQ